MSQVSLVKKISESFKRTTMWFSGCTKGSATTILNAHSVTDRDYIKLYGLCNVDINSDSHYQSQFYSSCDIILAPDLVRGFRSRGLHFSTGSVFLGGV